MTKVDKEVLDDQIRRRTTEMNDLAGKIAVAKGTKGTKGTNGTSDALLLVMPQGGYEDVAPELIAEDALRVMNQVGPRASTSKSSTDRSKSKRYDAFLID